MYFTNQKTGEIYQLQLGGKRVTYITGYDLYNELCDEKRFTKSVDFQLKEVRHGLGEGLFTSETIDESWKLAHRLLILAFGPMDVAVDVGIRSSELGQQLSTGLVVSNKFLNE